MDNSGKSLSIEYFGSSDIGLVRTENQDSMGKYPREDFNLYTEKGQLFIVADGMGGHTGGREASSTAVEEIINSYSQSRGGTSADQVRHAIESANQLIYNKAQASTENKKMGTTCVVLLIKDTSGIIAHVGDSRIYLVDNEEITQLTSDHTQVQEMLNRGILTKSEAAHYPQRSVLARALGVEKTVQMDIRDNIQIKGGQTFILCTDGLAKVSPEEILAIVNSNKPSQACDLLVKLANDRGGKDNVTVQVINIKEKVDVLSVQPKKKSAAPWLLFIGLIIIGAVYLFRGEVKKLFEKQQEIVPTDTVAPIQNPVVNIRDDKYSQLLQQAEKFIEYGRLERAGEMYKKILEEEPTHLGALKGINNLVNIYLDKAGRLVEMNQYKDALAIYEQLNNLQPGNKKVVEMIIVCRNRILQDSTSADTTKQDSLISNN